MDSCGQLVLNSPSGRLPRKHSTLPPVVFGEIFENGWLWTAASEQSKIAACNVIQFLTIKNCFGIML